MTDAAEVLVLRQRPRNGGRAVVLDYDDTTETIIMTQRMLAINDWIGQADLVVDEAVSDAAGRHPVSENRHLRRLFAEGRFDRGGRLYGGFWQDLGKTMRSGPAIRIGGEDSVELDLADTAPRILYGMVGVEPHWNDAYAVPHYGHCRDGIKKIFAALLFAKGRLTRMPPGAAKLFPPVLDFPARTDKDAGWQRRAEARQIAEISRCIASHHKPVKHLFCTGIGPAVEYRESEILIEILLRLKARRIVALPIHDSVLVAQSALPAAACVMAETFREMAGVPAAVTVKGEAPAS